MAVKRKITVNGALYDLVGEIEHDAKHMQYRAVVRRPSGEEATAYARFQTGPFVFRSGNRETQANTERTFTLIRHGKTGMNSNNSEQDFIRGWSDVPLTAEGRVGVEETAEKMVGSPVQVLVHSDLSRATETAAIIARKLHVPMQSSPLLRPWNVGQFTGQSSSTVLPHMHDYMVHHPHLAIPGGESFDTFRSRAMRGVSYALDKNADSHVGLVTHHRVERLIKAWLAAGQSLDGSVDYAIMQQKGEPPGNAERITLNASRLKTAEESNQ